MSDVRSELAEGSDEAAAAAGGGGSSRERAESGHYYADASSRLIAYLLDAIVLTVLAFVGAVVVSVLFGPVVTFDPTAAPYVTVNRALAIVDAAVTTALSAAYFLVGWRRYGGSIGMRLLGMTISTIDGEPVGWGQGALRWLFVGLPLANQGVVSVFAHGRLDILLSLALLAWYVLLGASIARHPRKRGFHDRAANTIVVKRGAVASFQPLAEDGRATRVR